MDSCRQVQKQLSPPGTSDQHGKGAINTGAKATPKVSSGENPATAAMALSAPTRFQSIVGRSVSGAVNCLALRFARHAHNHRSAWFCHHPSGSLGHSKILAKTFPA